MNEWTRIPAPMEREEDRRELAAILAAAGLEVRVVREAVRPRAYKRFVEYREQE
ncbi:hypothetical protein KQI82_06300 [Oscillibacter sp. MSJ-2]|uniref:Uncharacterized protein n=1 Tax=Dysosmobacter acutus TaxID=2841504 RepID=A0ABS6FB08_9FIRM|nr:hypothetical protein [Dysosmobacter acutus]MBU5626530.1 hypothetical protein [Dysosmobacter acutus]